MAQNNNLFKLVDGRYVMTEGYGSVETIEEKRQRNRRGQGRAIRRTDKVRAGFTPKGEEAPEDATYQIAKSQGGGEFTPRDRKFHQGPLFKQPGTATPEEAEANKTKQPSGRLAAKMRYESAPPILEFFRNAGLTDGQQINNILAATERWFQTNKIENKPILAPLANILGNMTGQATQQESKYINPRQPKSLVRHPSLVGIIR